jgi:arsenate reductase
MPVVIWHRPSCSNARGALDLIRAAGIEPDIVDYVGNPPSIEQLRRAIADAGLTVREAIRDQEAEYLARGLADPALSDEALLAAMVVAPILINRPFVFTPKGVRLCRPPERVREIL